MKSFRKLPVAVVLMVTGWITSYGQDIQPEVPGDHFSLEGALELFKKSASPEEFEKMLNSPDSKVNNLDLNGDGYIDYIRVFDRYEGNVHAFIIQAVVSDSENQDVAVIELEKLANGKAVLQIIGDEDIYGVETIIEPTREVRTYAGSVSAPAVVNVWAWPSVQYVYGPYYSGWYSPWGWHMRPVWWRSWRPVVYVHYYNYWRPYRPHYAVCHTHRVVYAHRIYRPYRTTSVIVHNRHHAQVNRYRSENRDGHRNGRTRNDERGTFTNNERSSSRGADHDRRETTDGRRSSIQREALTSDRTTARERSLSTDNLQRNSNDIKRDARNRTTETSPQMRSQVQSPAENRRHAVESSGVQQQQPSTVRERSISPDMERNSSSIKRDELRNSRSSATYEKREVRQQMVTPSETKSRSFESRDQQQRSSIRERKAPADFNRSSSGIQSEGLRNNSREPRQQMNKAPSVERNRSSIQQPSNRNGGGLRSSEIKRGRH